ncbi:hypothetical protein ILFOPFJJ_06625 [Ensifer psoraleae]|nr:hypothetical protein [Sinorhizobium psoraleae]
MFHRFNLLPTRLYGGICEDIISTFGAQKENVSHSSARANEYPSSIVACDRTAAVIPVAIKSVN